MASSTIANSVPARAARGPWRGRGTSLVEALVALVVVSVGTLSMTSLQMMSKRTVRDAGQRLGAAELAHGLVERLRANSSPDALRTYVAAASPYLGGGQRGDVPAPDCSSTAACTPEQLALFDLWLWEQVLDGVTEQVGTGANTANVGGLQLATACLAPPATGAGTAGNYTLTIAFRGTTAMPERADVACGRDAIFADGTPLYGAANEYRRLVTVQAYIAPAIPK